MPTGADAGVTPRFTAPSRSEEVQPDVWSVAMRNSSGTPDSA